MRNALTLAALVALAPAAALSKPWNGIDPGTSKRDEVIKKFGEPSKVVKAEPKETLAYLGDKAIKGTTQVQFKIDAASGTVERIDVFPAPVIDKDMVESSYGPACPASGSGSSKDPCYVKKITDNFKTYFIYPKLGLAVFFKDDNKIVSSLVYTSIPGGSKASGGGTAGTASPPSGEK
ncbi:MAG TPA: hypothetical protein VFA20_06015 [Myxococcaceae bacterium]|nr:hypothetical protein [Myxococcaceae bacterium]